LPRWTLSRKTEIKFNPWHDPDDGRFTFAGTGRYFGRGGTRGEARPGAGLGRGRRDSSRGDSEGQVQAGFDGGGAERVKPAPAVEPRRNGGLQLRHNQPPNGPSPPPSRASSSRPLAPVDDSRNWRTERKNGYSYHIDPLGRTRRVYGTLNQNALQRRSRSAQRRAGVPDRRTTDQGGHYIARRFNGPTEAFNHFAQDASFNRREYLELENRWAEAIRTGKHVYVSIEPAYEGSSQRPSEIVVEYWISGVRRIATFPNEPGERRRAKR